MKTIAATIRVSIQTTLEEGERLDKEKILYRFKKILRDEDNLKEFIRFEEIEPKEKE